MKLISVNIELNLHYDTVFGLIKKENPDVICIQELLEEDFDRFKNEFKMDGIYKPFYLVTLGHYSQSGGKKHGVAIFAKNISTWGYKFYTGSEENINKDPEDYYSDKKNSQNGVLLWADIKNLNGEVVRFATTHFTITKEGESTPKQLDDLNHLLEALEDLDDFVLCGDMNAPRGNETFTRLANKYIDNIPLEYKTSIDQNLHRVKGIMFMVDGLFTAQKYEASNVKLVDGVSDHMAIVADINLSNK